MSRVGPSIVARRRMAGLSLVELMIALVMALIVAAGIISVFESTSNGNKVQAQMAALQEQGRFAIQSRRSDLANANSGYCSNTGGNAGQTASNLYLDALRSPTVYAETALALPDNTVTTLPTPTQAYSLPSSLYMRGYDCTVGNPCTPAGLTGLAPEIPPIGTLVGDRVPGTDVLTIRYIRPGSGWSIGSPGGSFITATSGVVTGIQLVQLPGEDPVSDFTGTVAMLADCSNAQVFTVTNSGGGALAPVAAPSNYAQPLDITQNAAARVFDFTRDFQTVTYFLQVVCANNTTPCTGTTTGELVRVVDGGTANAANGGSTQALVSGVERLDFRYGIIGPDGLTRFLTATELDTGIDASGNPIASCPPGVSTPGGMPDDPADGCLWRAVQSIQVSILMDGQTPLYTLTPAELNYIYTPDSAAMEAPAAHAVPPSAQGFPNQLIRRQFTALVSLRNFNP